jgi:hypothetical protein
MTGKNFAQCVRKAAARRNNVTAHRPRLQNSRTLERGTTAEHLSAGA